MMKERIHAAVAAGTLFALVQAALLPLTACADFWPSAVSYQTPSHDEATDKWTTHANGCSTTASHVDFPATVNYDYTYYDREAQVYVTTTVVCQVESILINGEYGRYPSLESVSIGNGISSVYFNGCAALKDVELPDSVKSLSLLTCKGLTEIALPPHLTNISCRGCSGLTEIAIPDSVLSIGSEAFWRCSSLTRVKTGDGVTSIGESAFSYCSSLRDFEMGRSVKEIHQFAFQWSGSVENIYISDLAAWCGIDGLSHLPKKNIYLNGEVLTHLVVPSGVVRIEDSAFANLSCLTNSTIGDDVKEIGFHAFQNCTNLQWVAMNDSVETLGHMAFYGCSNLKEIALPASVATIGEYTFQNCTGMTTASIDENAKLTSITNGLFEGCRNLSGVFVVPSNVTCIGRSAFDRCSQMTGIEMPAGLKSVNEGAFCGCSSLTSVAIPDSVVNVGGSVFWNCSGLTSATIGNSVTNIGSGMFYGCGSLTNVTIGSAVASIGDESFRDCSSLTSLTIPDSVTTIGKYAFYSCRGITSLVIPDAVTTLGDNAFAWCGGLTSVVIGNSVMDIGNDAFGRCGNLACVTMAGDCPTVGEGSFDGVHSTCKVYLPRGNETYFVDGGKWQGMAVDYYAVDANVAVDTAVGMVERLDDGYVVVAADGVTLTQGDVFFGRALQGAYAITIAEDGKRATVTLARPTFGAAVTQCGAPRDERDPSGALVAVELEKIVARPELGGGVEIGALPVKTYEGLYYQVAWGDDLSNLTVGAKIQGTGDILYLGVIKQTGVRGFYKLMVGER